MGPQWNTLVQSLTATHDAHCMVPRLGRCKQVPVQYLMQILQAHYGDFVPRYQIFMFDDSKIYGSIPRWQEPTTVWDGKPVIGFMAETFLDDLSVVSRISIQCGRFLQRL